MNEPAPDAWSPATCVEREAGEEGRGPGQGRTTRLRVNSLHAVSSPRPSNPGEERDSTQLCPANPGCVCPHRTQSSAALVEVRLFGDGEAIWSVSPMAP